MELPEKLESLPDDERLNALKEWSAEQLKHENAWTPWYAKEVRAFAWLLAQLEAARKPLELKAWVEGGCLLGIEGAPPATKLRLLDLDNQPELKDEWASEVGFKERPLLEPSDFPQED